MNFNRNYLYLFLAAFIWSTSSTIVVNFQKIANPLLCASIVVITCTIFYTFFLSIFHKKDLIAVFRCKRQNLLSISFIGFFGIFGYPIFYFYGLHSPKPIEANIINYLWPLIVLISGFVLGKEKFEFRKLLGVLLGFAGIIFIVADFSTFTQTHSNNITFNTEYIPYYLPAFMGAIFYGLYTALLRNNTTKISGVEELSPISKFYIILLSSSILHVFIMLTKTSDPEYFSFSYTHKSFLFLIIYSIINFGIAYYLWMKAASNLPTSQTALLAFLIPIFSSIFLSFFNHTPMPTQIVYSLILVSLGIFVSQSKNIYVIPLVGAIIAMIFLSFYILVFPVSDNKNEYPQLTTAIIAIFSFYAGLILNRHIKNTNDENQLLLDIENTFLEIGIQNRNNKEILNEIDYYICFLIDWFYSDSNGVFKEQNDEQIKKLYFLHQKHNITFPLKLIIEKTENLFLLRNSKTSRDEWFILVLLVSTLIVTLMSQGYGSIVTKLSSVTICVGAITTLMIVYNYERRKPIQNFGHVIQHQRISKLLELPLFIPKSILISKTKNYNEKDATILYRGDIRNLQKYDSAKIKRNYNFVSLYLILVSLFGILIYFLKQ